MVRLFFFNEDMPQHSNTSSMEEGGEVKKLLLKRDAERFEKLAHDLRPKMKMHEGLAGDYAEPETEEDEPLPQSAPEPPTPEPPPVPKTPEKPKPVEAEPDEPPKFKIF